MAKPWLKLWTEILRDMKLRRIPPAQRWCWVALLCLAQECDEDGRLELAGEALTDTEIADACGVDMATWTAARSYFLRPKIGMLVEEGGTLRLVNFERRQASPDLTNAERKKRWRERHQERVPVRVPERSGTRSGTRKTTEERRQTTEEEAEADDNHHTARGESDAVSLSSSSFSSPGLERYREAILWRFKKIDRDIEALLPEMAEKGTPDVVLDAIAIAKSKRKAAPYALAILANWQAEGRGNGKGRNQEGTP